MIDENEVTIEDIRLYADECDIIDAVVYALEEHGDAAIDIDFIFDNIRKGKLKSLEESILAYFGDDESLIQQRFEDEESAAVISIAELRETIK